MEKNMKMKRYDLSVSMFRETALNLQKKIIDVLRNCRGRIQNLEYESLEIHDTFSVR